MDRSKLSISPSELCAQLGFPAVRNYDGSWTEWGNSVRVPITQGDKP